MLKTKETNKKGALRRPQKRRARRQGLKPIFGMLIRMPCPELQCEFCANTFRKDALAIHVKAKHVKELGEFLLKDFQEGQLSVLQSYCHSSKPSPIWSELHQEAAYWFGVKPAIFFGDDSWRLYVKSEQNIQSHVAFIEEVLSNISLHRFIQLGKALLLRAPGVLETSNALRRLQAEHKEMEERKNTYIASLEKSVHEWRETAEEKETNQEIRSASSCSRHSNIRLEKEVKALKEMLERQQQQSMEHEEDIRRKNLGVERQLMEEIDELRTKLGIVDKKKEKEDEKAKEKKRKAKAALKQQMKELKRQLKATDSSSSDSE